MGRHLFVVCMCLSWLMTLSAVAAPTEWMYTKGGGNGRIQWARVPILTVLTIVFGLLVYAWHQHMHEVATGLGILAIQVGARQWEKSLWHSDIVVSLGKYVPTSACLLGYTVAYGLTASDDPERVGWEAAIGVMGGIFTINGITKWYRGGLRWFGNQGIALLVVERSYTGRGFARRARRWLVSSPFWCIVLSAGTALLETGGVLLWIPEFRVPVSSAIVGVLLGFALFLGYLESEWVLLVIALALSAG